MSSASLRSRSFRHSSRAKPRLVFVSQPANGKTALVDQQVDYASDFQFIGEDAFRYVATDGRLFAVGQVMVEVISAEEFVYLPLIRAERSEEQSE